MTTLSIEMNLNNTNDLLTSKRNSRFDYKGINFLYFIYVIINSIAQGNAFMVWWFGNTSIHFMPNSF